MSTMELEEKNKVEPFFRRLNKLAANVESGVKEVQNKISLPKSDLPENSALIASVQLLDSLVALKNEVSNTAEQLDKTEHSMKEFIINFQKAVKDTEKKVDELENVLENYGYVPWKLSQPATEENTDQGVGYSENETTTTEDVVSQSTEMQSALRANQEKLDSKKSSTPQYSSRSLSYVLRNSTNKIKNDLYKYNAEDMTPQLKLRQSLFQRTPVCFSDDVICTPGLFIPFQQKYSRNGTMMKPNFCESTFFTSKQKVEEVENIYTNLPSPQFYEEDVTIELFKKRRLPPSYSCQENKESVTPEEPVLHAQHTIDEFQKSAKKNFSKREDSITPEEPVLHAQRLIGEIQKSSTKKNISFQSRIPTKDLNTTPESPKLKTLLYLKKSKIYQNFFQ